MKLKSVFAFSLILILLSSCDYRTSSKDRFEKITKIELSDSINVTEDRFESLGPDYRLFYKFDLNKNDCIDFKSKIKNSEGWVNNNNEWSFNITVDGTIYNITFFEQECQVSYNEDLI